MRRARVARLGPTMSRGMHNPGFDPWDSNIEPGPAPLGLAGREHTVFAWLRAKNVVVAQAYRRLIELSRADPSEDPLATLLAMHLCRELMNTLPRQFGVARSASVSYSSKLNDIIKVWPKPPDGERGKMPDRARRQLVALLDEQEASTTRPDEFVAFLLTINPAARAWVPPHVTSHWDRIRERALRVTHGLMAIPAVYPSSSDGRAVADDLTDTLYSAVAGHFDTTPTIEELVREPAPRGQDAGRVAAAIVTPAQAFRFFREARVEWFPVLAADPRFFGSPKDTANVEGGYIYPPWPEGDLILRAAASFPDEVLATLNKVAKSRNQAVLAGVVGILNALPIAQATRWVERHRGWPDQDQVVVTNARSLGELAAKIANDRDDQLAWELLWRVIKPLWDQRTDTMGDFLLGQALATIEERIIPAQAPAAVTFLLAKAPKMIKQSVRPFEASVSWLDRFDQEPEFAHDRMPWRVVQTLYRMALRLPSPEFAQVGAALRTERTEVLRRLGVALLAARPADDPIGVAEVISDPQRWDNVNTTAEFQSLAGASLALLDAATRDGLVDYIVLARDVTARYDDAFGGSADGPAREQVVAGWRSAYLWPARDQLTPAEAERTGPLVKPAAREGRRGMRLDQEPSPLSTAEMGSMGPRAVFEFLRTWRPTDRWSGPDEATVAGQLGAAVAADPSTWGRELVNADGLAPVYAYQIVEGFRTALRTGPEFDLAPLVDWLNQFVTIVDAGDGWRSSVERHAMGFLDDAITYRLTSVVDRAGRVADLVITLLGAPPKTKVEEASDLDLLTKSFNSTVGQAIYAGCRLVFAIAESAGSEAERLADALEERAITDRSAVTRTAFGRGLPWLISAPVIDTKALVEQLLEPNDPGATVAWNAYVLAWKPLDDVARRTKDFYAAAAANAGSDQQVGQRPFDLRERVGQHLVIIALRGTVDEAGDWLTDFYEHAPDSILADTTRFVADHLALADLPERMAEVAMTTLAERATRGGPMETRALGWASRTAVRQEEVLTRILRPAAARVAGTDDPTGVVGLLVRLDATPCQDVAGVLWRVVEGDEYEALPHLAGDELETVLRRLWTDGDERCRRVARQTIDLLGSRGNGRYGVIIRDVPAG